MRLAMSPGLDDHVDGPDRASRGAPRCLREDCPGRVFISATMASVHDVAIHVGAAPEGGARDAVVLVRGVDRTGRRRTFSGDRIVRRRQLAWIAPATATVDWQARQRTDAQRRDHSARVHYLASGSAVFHFVYTSDQHYGITRTAFRGGTNVIATS